MAEAMPFASASMAISLALLGFGFAQASASGLGLLIWILTYVASSLCVVFSCRGEGNYLVSLLFPAMLEGARGPRLPCLRLHVPEETKGKSLEQFGAKCHGAKWYAPSSAQLLSFRFLSSRR
jgi:hypothetical protein